MVCMATKYSEVGVMEVPMLHSITERKDWEDGLAKAPPTGNQEATAEQHTIEKTTPLI